MENQKLFKVEVSNFVKNEIYKYYDWGRGFTLDELTVVIEELLNFGFKIKKLKIKNGNGEIGELTWADYQTKYSHNWIIEAIEQISQMKSPRIFVVVSISESKFEKIISEQIENPKNLTLEWGKYPSG